MTEDDYLAWLLAIATGAPVPGEHPPAANPLEQMQ